MNKNIVTENLHVTKKAKVENLDATKANVKILDAEKIVDNGTVYGTSDQIKPLTTDPKKNIADAGTLEKVARVDHVHPIPEAIKNPNMLIINDNAGKPVIEYDGSNKKEFKLTPTMVGAAEENHASASEKFGIGNGEKFGHVKLSDAVNSGSGINSGVAATPAAIKAIADSYLSLDGKKIMQGTIQTRGNIHGATNPVHAIKIGANGYFSDLGSANIVSLLSAGNTKMGALSFGDDDSTILLSKNTGHLYLRNNSEDEKNKGFIIDGERMLVDYQVEQIVTKNGTSYWTPQRTGWYRIYVVGGGGNGANGYATSVVNRLGRYVGTNPSASENKHFEGTPLTEGYAIRGAGGGGGGVAIIDVYVSKSAYSYLSTIKEIKYTNVTDEETGEVEPEVIERVTVETPVLKRAVIRINTSAKTAQISNLYAVYGGTHALDIALDEGSEGTETSPDAEESEALSNIQPVIAYPGCNAIGGRRWNSNNTGNRDTDYKNNIKPTDANIAAYNSWFNGDPVNKNIVKTYFTGYSVIVNNVLGDGNKVDNDDYVIGDYFVQENTRYDGSVQGTADVTFVLYDGVTHMEKPNGRRTNTEINVLRNTLKHVTKDKVSVGSGFPIGFKTKLQYGIGTKDGQTLYAYRELRLSVPGLGGRAAGGDVNLRGGNGDQNVVKQPTAINDAYLSKYPDTYVKDGVTYVRRADGYCGGIPGVDGWTGCIGSNAAAGFNINQNMFRHVLEGTKWKYYHETTAYARSGYGSGLNISELGNYAGPSAANIKSGYAGYGYLGGGGGGGAAMFGMYKKTVTNEAGTTTSFANFNKTSRGNAGGAPCVVIAYLGDSQPKTQSTDTIIEQPIDTNKDGIDDTCQIFLNYVKKDSSVATLSNTSHVVTLWDDYTLDEQFRVATQFGTNDISDIRPTATPAFGYMGDPVYEPTNTIIDVNFGGIINVSFVKDPTKWHSVSFSAGNGGTLSGTTSFTDVLDGTSITIPSPVPNPGFEFIGWTPTLSGSILNVQSSATYTAVFRALYAVTFLAGDNGTLDGETELMVPEGTTYNDIIIPTPVPNEGFEFSAWSPVIPTGSVLVNSNVIYTATFTVVDPDTEVVPET